MFKKEEMIPEAEEILAKNPLPENLKKIKKERDRLVSEVISGKSDKMLMIVGPCSAHDKKAVLDYMDRLGKLARKVEDKVVIVPRIYTNKPRTKGVGYMGMFSQPDPESRTDILKGIYELRDTHIKSIEISGLSAADEMLYPENYAYVEDLLTYIAVGARSSENQMHRLVSSGVELPVGVKNPMSGSINELLNSIYAVQSPHSFKYHNYQVSTEGNPLGHAVLRGAVDAYGQSKPNYHYENVMELIEGYKKTDLKFPAVIIDTNHSNSGKQFKQQIRIVDEVMHNRLFDSEFKKYLKGFMVESFIVEGCQKKNEVYGQSITDPCLGWEDTERMILNVAEMV
jgi:3-deoxy-7-phosphoheptulonate synthase